MHLAPVAVPEHRLCDDLVVTQSGHKIREAPSFQSVPKDLGQACGKVIQPPEIQTCVLDEQRAADQLPGTGEADGGGVLAGVGALKCWNRHAQLGDAQAPPRGVRQPSRWLVGTRSPMSPAPGRMGSDLMSFLGGAALSI